MRIAPVVGALTFALIALTGCSKPKEWKEYPYPAWGFAATFPSAPQVADTPAGQGQPHSFTAQTQNDDMTLIALAADDSASKKTPDDAMNEVAHNMAAGVNGTLKGMTNITLGSAPGREFIIDVDRQPSQRVRVFAVNKKLYQVVAVSSKGTDDPESLKFLNAFRITN
jgi:hypothetical protein